MQLFVKSLSGQTLTVDAGADQTVADVKSALQVKQGMFRPCRVMRCARVAGNSACVCVCCNAPSLRADKLVRTQD